MKLNIISLSVVISTNLLKNSFKAHYTIPMGFRYSAEILTGLKFPRKSYLNFIMIFDLNVWLTLIASIILSWILFKIIATKFEFLNLATRMLTGQDCKWTSSLLYLLRIENKLKRIIIIIMLTIWIQSASILTKCFTELLLDTYLPVKSVPFVQNIQQINDEKDLIILSNKNMLKYWTRYDKIAMMMELENRILRAHNKTGIRFLADIGSNFEGLKLISQGKAVAVCSTNERNILENQFHKWNSLFTVLENKYLSNYAYFLVKTEYPFGDKCPFAKPLLFA